MSQPPANLDPSNTPDRDVDMSMSITLPPPTQPAQGQNHDRDNDDTFEAGEAMDTTPDGSSPEAVGEGDVGVLVTSANVETSSDEERLAFQAIVDAANNTNAILPPAVVPSTIPPPPQSGDGDDATPPPQSRSQSPRNRNRNRHRDTSSSGDEDDGTPPWHEIHEDTSSPSEGELKEIAAHTEYSALTHEHWESKTFTDYEDSEYQPGASGRISWTITGYNGTKEKPNRELIMKSEVVRIGGYDWQLKFFPRGNDSDYLSVYVDCVSLSAATDEAGEGDETVQGAAKSAPPAPESAMTINEDDTALLNLPIPLLPGQNSAISKGVCAQVGVVLYNPSEPRVNMYKSWTHRHCERHSDYGQTRFHGPYYEIALRQRGQRAAMLRNDTLAITAYIRIVHDKTNCLGEHPDFKTNPWNSFAMTGLQGLSMMNRPRGMSSSNVVSAVATWMLLPPFRQFLYSVQHLVPDPTTTLGARQPPMPLLKALLKILYCLRTPELCSSGAQNVNLHDLYDAITWYGIDTKMDALDVVQVMEIFRTKLQTELVEADSDSSLALSQLLGAMKDHHSGLPTYRVEADDSFQAALLATPNAVRGTPSAITVEVQRQAFENSTRTWKKLAHPMKLEHEIHVNGSAYQLHSFVAHDESLQSGGYRTILRHQNGAESEWYLLQDNRMLPETRNNANFRVERITERTMRQLAGETVGTSQSVAYLVTYVRTNAKPVTESWEVAPWILSEVAVDREMEAEFNGEKALEPDDAAEEDADVEAEPESKSDVEFQILDSRSFMQHTGPGIVDVYSQQTPFKSVVLPAYAKVSEIQEKLMGYVDGVKDPRQLRVRLVDSHSGIFGKPVLLQDEDEYHRGNLTMAKLAERISENRLWIHVVDEKDLPPKEEEKKKPEVNGTAPDVATDGSGNTGAAFAEAQVAAMHNEENRQQDAVMSDVTEPNPWATAGATTSQPSGNPVTVIELPTLLIDANGNPVVNGTPITPGGVGRAAQMDIIMPNGHVISMPRKVSLPSTEEIYFFLKVFDTEKQQFVPKGSFIENKKARVDKTIAKILGINGSSDAEDFPDMYEEDDLLTVRSLRRRKTFQQEDLHNTAIIVVNFSSKVDAASLHARGLAATPEEYLQHTSYKRNFSHLWSSDDLTFDYFSSERYTGGWLAGKPHHQGTKISFDGSVYTGDFQLGQRHGQGQITYPNGDTYAGAFKNNMRDGHGTFTESATGNSYEGGWQVDKQFGKGVKRYEQAEYDERNCRVCWVDEADAVFVDCGHVMMCLGCARRVDVCPKCRAKVKFAIKFWLD